MARIVWLINWAYFSYYCRFKDFNNFQSKDADANLLDSLLVNILTARLQIIHFDKHLAIFTLFLIFREFSLKIISNNEKVNWTYMNSFFFYEFKYSNPIKIPLKLKPVQSHPFLMEQVVIHLDP